jgi:hypothetical protein
VRRFLHILLITKEAKYAKNVTVARWRGVRKKKADGRTKYRVTSSLPRFLKLGRLTWNFIRPSVFFSWSHHIIHCNALYCRLSDHFGVAKNIIVVRLPRCFAEIIQLRIKRIIFCWKQQLLASAAENNNNNKQKHILSIIVIVVHKWVTVQAQKQCKACTFFSWCHAQWAIFMQSRQITMIY